MRAQTLRNFFAGRLTGPELARDLSGAFEQVGPQTRRLRMADDLAEEFTITASHLVRLCDAVLAGEVPAEALEAIGFGLIASDEFCWDSDTPDGSRVAEALYDWAAPEVNYALTPATVAKFRHRLLTGEDTFTQADFAPRSA